MKIVALTDAELVRALKELIAKEHGAIADVVEYLAEVDARRLHITAACSSLTAYCQERLGYSQFEAAHRVTAARLAQKYPLALEMLRSGALCLSVLRVLSPVLTAETHRARLEAAVGKTRNEVELLVAGWQPKPDVPTRITPVRFAETPPMLAAMTAKADENRLASAPSTEPPPSPPSKPAPLPKPLTPERFKLELTIDAETRDDLMKLRDHLRHAIPDGDVSKILKRALKELRASVESRKFGKRRAEKPATSMPEQAALLPDAAPLIDEGYEMPRAPGRATRREVAKRDNYQCCYVSDDGDRCASTAWIEYDHKLEHALNGPTWTDNMQLLCRAHHRAKHRASDDDFFSGHSDVRAGALCP
jgi:5-methylcytosine-specific restriction endonuclease McrA